MASPVQSRRSLTPKRHWQARRLLAFRRFRTAAADTNTTQAASTAFVLGQVGTASPAMNGVATEYASLRYARQDHTHPIDTSRTTRKSSTLQARQPRQQQQQASHHADCVNSFVQAQIASTVPNADTTTIVR